MKRRLNRRSDPIIGSLAALCNLQGLRKICRDFADQHADLGQKVAPLRIYDPDGFRFAPAMIEDHGKAVVSQVPPNVKGRQLAYAPAGQGSGDDRASAIAPPAAGWAEGAGDAVFYKMPGARIACEAIVTGQFGNLPRDPAPGQVCG